MKPDALRLQESFSRNQLVKTFSAEHLTIETRPVLERRISQATVGHWARELCLISCVAFRQPKLLRRLQLGGDWREAPEVARLTSLTANFLSPCIALSFEELPFCRRLGRSRECCVSRTRTRYHRAPVRRGAPRTDRRRRHPRRGGHRQVLAPRGGHRDPCAGQRHHGAHALRRRRDHPLRPGGGRPPPAVAG